MKTSLECERSEGAESAKGRISFSVDSLLGSKSEAPRDTGDACNDAESGGDSDDSDVDIEDVESTTGDDNDRDERNSTNDDESETRSGVVVPQPLLPRLYQGPAPATWPFGAFPWMAPNPMFRTGSPNGKLHSIDKIFYYIRIYGKRCTGYD